MMHIDDMIIREKAKAVFTEMETRVYAEEMARIRAAFELARKAHAAQKRKSGEPYVIHPIAVAAIVAMELKLGANPVIAAFLHEQYASRHADEDSRRDRLLLCASGQPPRSVQCEN